MNPFLFRLFRDSEIRLHELSYLFWECTTRCQLHCRHCGSDCFMESRDKDMPLEDFLGVLDTIPVKDRPKEFTVVLTGGEPLLRPDIAEAGAAIKAKGFNWGMVSNGYLYDEAMHRRLGKAGMGALTISLDGLEASHDWMRGREGSFARAVNAIKIAAGSPRLYYDVVTCVNRRNFHELPAIREMLEGMHVRQWRLFTIIPIGRAKDDPEMHLDDAEFRGLMEFIAAARCEAKEAAASGRRMMNVTFGCEGFLGPFEEKVRPSRYFCRAGITVASVLADGRICACPNNDRDRFSQGSIYTDNFWDVWNNRFGQYRDRRWTRTGTCEGCPEWRNCLGNGMHNWHGDGPQVLNCHYAKIQRADIAEMP